MTTTNLQFFAADLQFIAWVKKKARVCVPFFRGLFSPGAAKTVGANNP
jgi:hypothetical protein